MYTLQTQIDAEIAHRLYNVNTYSEECKNNIHGHSYKFTFIIGCKKLNEANMVCDFKLLKKILKDYIEQPFDHSAIIKEDDPLAEPIKRNCKKVHIVKENPTAEWMSKLYFDIANKAFKENNLDIFVKECRVQETEHNIAIYSED